MAAGVTPAQRSRTFPEPHPRRLDHDPARRNPPRSSPCSRQPHGPWRRPRPQQPVEVLHKTVKVGDLDIFYREAGPKDAPTLLLLHGFPTSSQMFRKLIPALADKYHVVAPDYPGYGHSSMPPHDKFSYTFDNLAKVDGRVHRQARADEVRPLRARLRRPGRLSPGGRPPGADHRDHRAERQRLRRGPGQRLLEADQGVLGRPEAARRSGTPCDSASPTTRPDGSTRTG